MPSFNPNIVIFGGDEKTLCVVLRTMAANYASSASRCAERGLDEPSIDLPDEGASADELLAAVSVGCGEPVYLLDPTSWVRTTSEAPTFRLEALDNGERAVLLALDTDSLELGEAIRFFTYDLPQGDYAMAASCSDEERDRVYVTLGNPVDGGPCSCGPRPDEDRAFCADAEGSATDELRERSAAWEGGEGTQAAVNRLLLETLGVRDCFRASASVPEKEGGQDAVGQAPAGGADLHELGGLVQDVMTHLPCVFQLTMIDPDGTDNVEELLVGDELVVTSSWREPSGSEGPVRLEAKTTSGKYLGILREPDLSWNRDVTGRSRAVLPAVACLLPHLRMTVWRVTPASMRFSTYELPEVGVRVDLGRVDVGAVVGEALALAQRPLGERALQSRLEGTPARVTATGGVTSQAGGQAAASEGLEATLDELASLVLKVPVSERPKTPAAVKAFDASLAKRVSALVRQGDVDKKRLQELGLLLPTATMQKGGSVRRVDVADVAERLLGARLVTPGDPGVSLLPPDVVGIDLDACVELRERVTTARGAGASGHGVGERLGLRVTKVDYCGRPFKKIEVATKPFLELAPLDDFHLFRDVPEQSVSVLGELSGAEVVSVSETGEGSFVQLRVRHVAALRVETLLYVLWAGGVLTRDDLRGDLAWRYRLHALTRG